LVFEGGAEVVPYGYNAVSGSLCQKIARKRYPPVNRIHVRARIVNKESVTVRVFLSTSPPFSPSPSKERGKIKKEGLSPS